MSRKTHAVDRRTFLAAGAGAVATLAAGDAFPAAPARPRIVVARGGARMPAERAAYERLKAALERYGGFQKLVGGKPVLVKINACDKKSQDANSSTGLTAALLRLCRENGAGSVKVLGQEWGGYDCRRKGQPTLRQVIKREGAALEELSHWWQKTKQYVKRVPKTGGWKELWVAKEIFAPDTVLLNTARCKTHPFVVYTGCVKNNIGLTHHMYAFHCEKDTKGGDSDKHAIRKRGWKLLPAKMAGAYNDVFRERTALCILDAGDPAYGWGGPKPERVRTFPANTVIVGRDGLAVDVYGMQMLHEDRPKDVPKPLADWTGGDGVYVKANLTGGNYLAVCQELGAGQGDLGKVQIDRLAID
jgi:uncharacterized protein (DUF362 family)